jgi:hypothetical protein
MSEEEDYLRRQVDRENMWYFHTTGIYCHRVQTWVVLDPAKCGECDKDTEEKACYKYGGKHDNK